MRGTPGNWRVYRNYAMPDLGRPFRGHGQMKAYSTKFEKKEGKLIMINLDINIVLAIAAISQAFFTAVIMWVTIKYTRSTKHLVELQIYPDIRIELLEKSIKEKYLKIEGKLTNYSGCDVTSLNDIVQHHLGFTKMVVL